MLALSIVLSLFVLVCCGVALVLTVRRRNRDQTLIALFGLFAPVAARAMVEPSELIAWSDTAQAARRAFPDLFQELDRASEGSFPFSRDLIESAHAKWTSDWLAWEQEHDFTYKHRINEIEHELQDASTEKATSLRASLEATEQEKLQAYQQRYEEYVRIGKAISEL